METVNLTQMPKVGELWLSAFGFECVITSINARGDIFFYKGVLKNGRHYEGAFETKGILSGAPKKLADKAPEDHLVFLPEKIVEKFVGIKLEPPSTKKAA